MYRNKRKPEDLNTAFIRIGSDSSSSSDEDDEDYNPWTDD